MDFKGLKNADHLDLEKVFGSTPNQQHPRVFDIGNIGSNYTSEFRIDAELQLAYVGRRGSLGPIFNEPIPGSYGSDIQEFIARVLVHLAQNPVLSPRVRNALETDNVLFLVGMTEDGCRHLGLVILE